jgi:N-acetylmuramoyl-L-alanine amidase CwlA
MSTLAEDLQKMQERRVAEVRMREQSAERKTDLKKQREKQKQSSPVTKKKAKAKPRDKGKGKAEIDDNEAVGKARKEDEKKRDWITPSNGFGGLSTFPLYIINHLSRDIQ